MNKILLLLCVFQINFNNMYCQDIVPESLLVRTFNISFKNDTATTFLIEHKGFNYFITARHLFSSNDKQIAFGIARDKGWHNLNGEVFFHDNPLVDIAVIKPFSLEKTNAIKLDFADITLGDNGVFLGYPYGFRTNDNSNLNLGFPFPLIKRANFSGISTDNNVVTLWLDGHNNPGFSGGPIFFKRRADPADQNWYLAGVISAYISQLNKLITPLGELKYTENSGLVVAIGAKHIIEIIEGIK